MNFVKITTAITILLATAPTYAESRLVRVFDKDGVTVTVQNGPLPGTVIFLSPVFYNSVGAAPGKNAGAIRGWCSTLVNEPILQRDLAKSPLLKEEILGFSCTTKLD